MTIHIQDHINRTLREARRLVAWGKEERVEVVVSDAARLRTLKVVVYSREGRFIRKEVR